MTRAAAVAGLLLALACGSRESSEDDGEQLFDDTVAVFLLADAAMLDSVRAGYTEDDFAVIADDMMWYRAEAGDWLEQRGIRTVYLEGRPPLRFVIEGEAAPFDFGAPETLDLVVLYRPGRAPIAVAPVDVASRGPVYYFGP